MDFLTELYMKLQSLEANSDRYETTATNDKGKITFDENKVVFTNTKNEWKFNYR